MKYTHNTANITIFNNLTNRLVTNTVIIDLYAYIDFILLIPCNLERKKKSNLLSLEKNKYQ